MMTYGTPAYGGLIDTGKAKENRAEWHSPGRMLVLVSPGCSSCFPSPQVPGMAGVCAASASPEKFQPHTGTGWIK